MYPDNHCHATAMRACAMTPTTGTPLPRTFEYPDVQRYLTTRTRHATSKRVWQFQQQLERHYQGRYWYPEVVRICTISPHNNNLLFPRLYVINQKTWVSQINYKLWLYDVIHHPPQLYSPVTTPRLLGASLKLLMMYIINTPAIYDNY